MNKKELYTSPEVDVFVVQTEGVVCTSGGFDPNSWGEGSTDWWSDPNF